MEKDGGFILYCIGYSFKFPRHVILELCKDLKCGISQATIMAWSMETQYFFLSACACLWMLRRLAVACIVKVPSVGGLVFKYGGPFQTQSTDWHLKWCLATVKRRSPFQACPKHGLKIGATWALQLLKISVK